MIGHVRSVQNENESFCGEKLGNEFYFKSIDAAALNGIHLSQVTTCEHCVSKIITCLTSGVNYDSSS